MRQNQPDVAEVFSDAAVEASGASPPMLVIRDNNCATNDPCAICGARTDPDVGPELMVEGSCSLVCYDCGRRHAPLLVGALMAYRESLHENVERVDRVRQSLLKKYSTREPKAFIQVDCFSDQHGDAFSDADGDGVFGGVTWELMHGSSVRILCAPDEPPENVVRILRKMADMIQTGFTNGMRAKCGQLPSVPDEQPDNGESPF